MANGINPNLSNATLDEDLDWLSIDDAYSAALEHPCTCGQGEQGEIHCPHCNRWEKARAMLKRAIKPSSAARSVEELQRELDGLNADYTRVCHRADWEREQREAHYREIVSLREQLVKAFATSSTAATSDLVQAVLKAIAAIPPDNVDDIEKAVSGMSKVSVAAYFRGRGINQAESAFLEAAKSLQSATGDIKLICPACGVHYVTNLRPTDSQTRTE